MKRLAILLLAFPIAASAEPTTVDFEVGAPCCFAETTPLTAIGDVVFNGVNGNGGSILNESGNFGIGARSGSDFYAFNTRGGSTGSIVDVSFGSLINGFSIYAFSRGGTVSAEAYSSSNALLSAASATETSAWTLLNLDVSSIARVRLSFSGVCCAVFDDLTYDAGAAGRMVSALALLGDINGDGTQDFAALVERGDTLVALVKDAEDGRGINVVEFGSSLVPVDLEVMADINANGAPELVVLGRGSTAAEVRDSLTGQLLGAVEFDPALSPIDLELIADQTGNAVPELAMLGQGSVKVEIKDPLTQSPINNLAFNDRYIPKDLSVWRYGDTTAVGVLGESKNPSRSDKVEIRNLDSEQITTHLWLGKPWRLLQMELLADLNGNGSPEAVVLREHAVDGRVSVLPVDTASGARFRHLGFDPNYRPVRMRIVDDVNGNGAEEVAVLAVRRGSGNQKVWIKDARSGKSVRHIFFGKTYIGEDMGISPDINGNGTPEVVVLGRNNDGVLRVIIKDSKTGEFISSVGLP